MAKYIPVLQENAGTHEEGTNIHSKRVATTQVDVTGLERDLRASISGEVRFDNGARALYATDGSHYRQIPLGVVLPKTADEVVQTISICHHYGAPLVMRGGGTSLAGQGCNVAVVIDLSKYMHEIIELDVEHKRAHVQPGVILDHLRSAAERAHLTFGPDPATHDHCTLGGMIGNNSCGTHSVMAGKTVENVESLDIVTYDGLRMRVGKTSDEELERIIQDGGRRGEIYARLKALRDRYADLIRRTYPDIPRRVSGYNLDQLLPEHGFNVARALVGSESTCVTVLEATLNLVDSPPQRVLLVLGYPDAYRAADHVPEILRNEPIALEGFDQGLVEDMRKKGLHPQDAALLPEGGGWLLVEFGGDRKEEAKAKAQALIDHLQAAKDAPSVRLLDEQEQAARIWAVRESALADTAFVPGKKTAWTGWEDSAVPPAQLGAYLRDLRALLEKYGYESDFYGHFGQGCVHTRIDFDFETAQGIENYNRFVHEAARIVLHYGGSLSGEHGDGQSRAELLPEMFGPELIEAFREFKSIWDPQWKMNPGKVVNAYRITENLRLGTSYNPLPVRTHFKFPEDQGSFARATLRCVGVGKCRRTEGGTMCPSFMVTREEADATRGRAHLLFEMLRGEAIGDGWHDENVREALDLCLACKGCKGDCPVNVDMATYKAEFLSHYYEGKLRPATAYSMGLIYWWARVAALMPEAVNLLMHTSLISSIAKMIGGIAPQRAIPTFASETFQHWFARRAPRNVGAPQVMLWPDTFNNHFHPETAIAAVEVLEEAGYQVIVPQQTLCCGRPLYDYGYLDLAERLLRQVLDTLAPSIEAGIPLVGLEPSCASVFRDELKNLFPHDENALRLSSQTFLLSEFLTQKVENYQPPRLQGKAVVHGHCHHKAIMKMGAEEEVLAKTGLDFQVLDSGCCGMAGAFGFETNHYDIAMKAGERVLLPAVRTAAEETVIIADGFSCREQIAQGSKRKALHLAQILQLGLHQQDFSSSTMLPETQYEQFIEQKAPLRKGSALLQLTALLAGIGVVVILSAWVWKRTIGSMR